MAFRIARKVTEDPALGVGIGEVGLGLKVPNEEIDPAQEAENVSVQEVGIGDTGLELDRATGPTTQKSRNFRGPISTITGSRRVTLTNETRREWGDGKLKIEKSTSARLSRDRDESRAVRAHQRARRKNLKTKILQQNRFAPAYRSGL